MIKTITLKINGRIVVAKLCESSKYYEGEIEKNFWAVRFDEQEDIENISGSKIELEINNVWIVGNWLRDRQNDESKIGFINFPTSEY